MPKVRESSTNISIVKTKKKHQYKSVQLERKILIKTDDKSRPTLSKIKLYPIESYMTYREYLYELSSISLFNIKSVTPCGHIMWTIIA